MMLKAFFLISGFGNRTFLQHFHRVTKRDCFDKDIERESFEN